MPVQQEQISSCIIQKDQTISFMNMERSNYIMFNIARSNYVMFLHSKIKLLHPSTWKDWTTLCTDTGKTNYFMYQHSKIKLLARLSYFIYSLIPDEFWVHYEQRYSSEHRLPSILRITLLHSKSSPRSTINAQYQVPPFQKCWRFVWTTFCAVWWKFGGKNGKNTMTEEVLW